MERSIAARSRLGVGVDAASTAGTAFNVVAGGASTAAAVRDVRSVSGKVVSRGRGGSAARPRASRAKAPASTLDKVARVAARVADSRTGNAAAAVLNRVAASPAMQIAAKASLPLLAFRAGVNMTKGYAVDGARGAVRGAVSTLDPTSLVTMWMGDQRGVGERVFDKVFGRAPAAASSPTGGAFLNSAAATRTAGNEAAAASDGGGGQRQAAAPEKPKGGAFEVKAHTRSDGTPVAGYVMNRKAL